MYESLIKIGLKKFLNNYFFEKEWLSESHLKQLSVFVNSKSAEQKKVLKKKFSQDIPHLNKNDLLHELMIASVFHPDGLFQAESDEKSPDIIEEGTRIEIKTINPSAIENERIKSLEANSVRHSLPKDTEYESRIRTKFRQRVDKAKEQVGNNGLVYLIWNSDFVANWSIRKSEIQILMNKLVSEEKCSSPQLRIKILCSEDLIKMVSKTKNPTIARKVF